MTRTMEGGIRRAWLSARGGSRRAAVRSRCAGSPRGPASPDRPAGRRSRRRPEAPSGLGGRAPRLARRCAAAAAGAAPSSPTPRPGQALLQRRLPAPLLASNMKMFTTATALDRLGPDEQFETALVAVGTFAGGVVQGDLVLRGGGDPTLTRQGLARLAAEARAAGLTGSPAGCSTTTRSSTAGPPPPAGIGGGPFGARTPLGALLRERPPARPRQVRRADRDDAAAQGGAVGIEEDEPANRPGAPGASSLADVTSSPLSGSRARPTSSRSTSTRRCW